MTSIIRDLGTVWISSIVKKISTSQRANSSKWLGSAWNHRKVYFRRQLCGRKTLFTIFCEDHFLYAVNYYGVVQVPSSAMQYVSLLQSDCAMWPYVCAM